MWLLGETAANATTFLHLSPILGTSGSNRTVILQCFQTSGIVKSCQLHRWLEDPGNSRNILSLEEYLYRYFNSWYDLNFYSLNKLIIFAFKRYLLFYSLNDQLYTFSHYPTWLFVSLLLIYFSPYVLCILIFCYSFSKHFS